MSLRTSNEPVNGSKRVYRHSLAVRIFHWLNALCFMLLLMSGLQIFNAYPRLHWGAAGYAKTPAIFEITGSGSLQDRTSWLQVGSYRIYTSGFLGVPHETPVEGVKNMAFPGWMTLPSGLGELGYGRGWHFLAAWIFAFNLTWYLPYTFVSGRFSASLLPTLKQLRPAAIIQDLWAHLRLRRHTGPEAAHYNLLQKIAYLSVYALLPLQILSGMTLSNSALAVCPWLLDLFGGRQSARTAHFIVAFLLLAFLLIHLFQVFLNGFTNHMRSMITGYHHTEEAP
jgi:thiosulfate reductase cytochrome b subunit